MRILKADEMRSVEEHAARSGLAYKRMMENAGAACARNIRNICEKELSGKKNICIVCGKGNNGGDGFVIARKLSENGFYPKIILADGYPGTEDAIDNYKMTIGLGILSVWYDSEREKAVTALKDADVIVDAVYGFGFHGELSTDMKMLFGAINSSSALVISVDIPSGVYCDNGKMSDSAIKADYTIAVSALKPAHIIYPAAENCGDIIVVNIGITEESFRSVKNTLFTLSPREIKQFFPKRETTGHKGSFGHALLICGSRKMTGAAELSAKAALRSGAGLVTVAFPECMYIPMATKLTEALLLPLEANDEGTLSEKALPYILAEMEKCDAVLIGCGIGVNKDTVKIVSSVIANAKCPVIIDADGINAVSTDINMLRKAAVPVILTPHPGEMSRLIGVSVENIQSDRVAVAKNFSGNYFVTLALKGANTIVTGEREEGVYVNSTGNTGLSKGGSGDLLAGLMTGFVAQGMDPQKAAQAAVYIHGYLGEQVSESTSVRGMLPSDMLGVLPAVMADFSE